MSINIKVRVGVEWINDFPQGEECDQHDLPDMGSVSVGFYNSMGSRGHIQVFNWGNNNAWSTDIEHPDFGGDSLNWSDNVHFCYYADHGGNWDNLYNIGFAVQHNDCTSSSDKWHFGVKSLKWLALDACQLVLNTEANHIINVWSKPMQGIHLVFGSIGDGSSDSNEGKAFADAICNGAALANAWLDTTYFPKRNKKPIAIAAGESRDDAINRRENETLNWRDLNVKSTNWLAWKWRG